MLKLAIAATAVTVVLPLAFMLAAAGGTPPVLAAAASATAPTAKALHDIPANYLAWYLAAAQTCPGLPWEVLAAIGTVETDNGQSTSPGVHSGANFAGAEGPMQFEPTTFAEYAVNADPAAPLSPYDPEDAIFTAANMLCANGAKSGTADGIRQAVFAYNHANWYVNQVLTLAAKYAAPQQASTIAEQAIAFAEQQIGKPYVWGATGPDAYDCSGLVYAAYASAGIAIGRTTFDWRQDGPAVPLDQLEPGDLLFSAGADGTATSPDHVVMYLGGGQVIQAPQTGQLVQTGPADLSSVLVATRPADLATSHGGTR